MLWHNTPGAASCDVLPAALLNSEGKPGRAFGLLAISDVEESPRGWARTQAPKRLHAERLTLTMTPRSPVRD